MDALRKLIEGLEEDRRLDEPHRLRERLEAVDQLDALFVGEPLSDRGNPSIETEDFERARAMYERLEAANLAVYEGIRAEIEHGRGDRLREWARRLGMEEDGAGCASGESYDCLDELIGGVLRFKRPGDRVAPLAEGMVFYQPTPARHIFDLMRRAGLTEHDVLIDLGSGLGHVPLIASISTGASAIGIELEAAYIDCARQCAQALHLNKVRFVQQDARAADLSAGTVFYLYTPFAGPMLRAVLDALRVESSRRAIRVCTFGPCTLNVADEPWLRASGAVEAGRIAVFSSCD